MRKTTIYLPSFRVVAALAVVAATAVSLFAVSSGRSSPAPAPEPAAYYQGPMAHAAGGSTSPLLFPAIVNIRLVRAQAALERATASVDQDKGRNAVIELKAARLNMAMAWSAARFVIRTSPPPLASGGAVAHAGGSSGGAPASPFASPQDTAFAVLSLQHDVITTSLGIMNTTRLPVAAAVGGTIRTALNARDAAIVYIHTLRDPVASGGGVRANASGSDVVTGWAGTMPTLVPLLNDETLQLRATAKPQLAAADYLGNLRTRVSRTRAAVNTYWPPIPGG
jgi:hypothetical protein